MKIIHVIFSLDYGGAETMLVDTMNGQVDFATVHLMVLNNVVNPHLRDTIEGLEFILWVEMKAVRALFQLCVLYMNYI